MKGEAILPSDSSGRTLPLDERTSLCFRECVDGVPGWPEVGRRATHLSLLPFHPLFAIEQRQLRHRETRDWRLHRNPPPSAVRTGMSTDERTVLGRNRRVGSSHHQPDELTGKTALRI